MSLLIRNPKTLGTIIQSARRQRGESQATLGEKVNLRQSAISMIEKGHAPLKLETLLIILAELDLDLQICPRVKGSAEQFADLF